MADRRSTVPGWFTAAALALALWGVMGCWAWFQQLRLGPAAWGPDVTDWDRAFYAALPGWYVWVYAVAVGAGFVGSIALVIRAAVAQPLFVASLIAVIVMFGWTFVATDLIAHKGVLVATGFPVVVAVIAGLQLWLARTAQARGWLR